MDAEASGMTDTSRMSRVVRLYVPLLMVAGAFASLARLAARPLGNWDTYFHLRFGHEFIDEWSLRNPGSVSSFATADWVPTQWLSQVAMAWTEDTAGLAGVAFLSGIQLCGLALTLYWLARARADPLPSAVLLVISLIALGPFISMRPQVLSFILIALTTHFWLKAPTVGRPPWILVPLTWAWAMSHGMWPIGIVIGLAAVLGWSMDDWPGPAGLLRRLSVPLATAFAAALTPLGPELYRAVLAVGSRSDYFAEWQPADFTSPSNLTAVLMIVGLGVLLLRCGTRDWLTIALTLIAVGSALYSSRTVPVAVAMIVPLVATQVQLLIGSRSPASRAEGIATGAFVAVALAGLAVATPQTAANPPAQPAWVDKEVGSLPAGTAILNDWGWGGYLMWRYPQLDLVMHGYGDTFTLAELERNRDILDLAPGWDDAVDDLDVSYALLNPDSPLAYALERSLGWRVVRHSRDVALLEAP